MGTHDRGNAVLRGRGTDTLVGTQLTPGKEAVGVVGGPAAPLQLLLYPQTHTSHCPFSGIRCITWLLVGGGSLVGAALVPAAAAQGGASSGRLAGALVPAVALLRRSIILRLRGVGVGEEQH